MSERGDKLAKESDLSRAQLLEIIEDANDELADAVPHMNRHTSHEEVRPSAILSFDRMQDAIDILTVADPTRTED